MNKVANSNILTAINDYKQFLKELYTKLNVNINYNKNLLQVVQEEITQNNQIFKKSDALKIEEDQPYYSNDVVSHICQFIISYELRQNARLKLYIVCLISTMCDQDEMLGYKIKIKNKKFEFEQIFLWVVDAWSYLPEDEEFESIEDKEQKSLENLQNQQTKNIIVDRNEGEENISTKEQLNQILLESRKNLDQKMYEKYILDNKFDKLEKIKKQFQDNKQEQCLKFSCQIFGGLDIKQFYNILQYLNKILSNLIEDENNNDAKQKKNQSSKDPNNKNITIIQDPYDLENKLKFYLYTKEDEIQSDQVLNEKNAQIENNIPNLIYQSENTLCSQQNLSMQSDIGFLNKKTNYEFIILCLLQIIKYLEQDRIRQNHVDQCFLFTKNSQLVIEKLHKGQSDFQIVVGFKITIKRQNSFTLLRVFTEKNNEILLQTNFNINQENQKSNIQFIFQGQKQEKFEYTLELGDTKQILNKWLTLQIIFPSHSKQKIQFIATNLYNKSEVYHKEAQFGNSFLDSQKYVNVIIGDNNQNQQTQLSEIFKYTFLLYLYNKNDKKDDQDGIYINDEYLFKLNSLGFGKELKQFYLGNLIYSNNTQQSYILNKTVSNQIDTIHLNIQNPYNNQIGQSNIVEFKDVDINEHFCITERHEKTKQSFFKKIFQSKSDKKQSASNSSQSTSEHSEGKSSWKVNQMKIKYQNIMLYEYNYPLNVLDKIGNMDIFYYILNFILEKPEISVKKTINTEQKFLIMKELFEIMQQFNESHSLILTSLNEYIRKLFEQKLINQEKIQWIIIHLAQTQLESYHQFFIERNGFILLQNMLQNTLTEFKNDNCEYQISKIFLSYYKSWKFDKQMSQRCFVNFLLNFELIKDLDKSNQIEILRFIENEVLVENINLELQKSNKIEYLLSSCIKYYLTNLHDLIVQSKTDQTTKQNNTLNSKQIQGLMQNTYFNEKEDDNQTISSNISSQSQFSQTFKFKNTDDYRIENQFQEFNEKEQIIKSIFNVIYNIIKIKQSDNLFINQFQSILNYLSDTQGIGSYLEKIISKQNLQFHICQQPSDNFKDHISSQQTNQFINKDISQNIKDLQGQNITANRNRSQSNNTLKEKTEQQLNKSPKNNLLQKQLLNLNPDKPQYYMKQTNLFGIERKQQYTTQNLKNDSNYLNSQNDQSSCSSYSNFQEYCMVCNSPYSTEKTVYYLIKLQYSLFIKEMVYTIRRLMLKDINKSLIFRRIIITTLVQNEQMISINQHGQIQQKSQATHKSNQNKQVQDQRFENDNINFNSSQLKVESDKISKQQNQYDDLIYSVPGGVRDINSQVSKKDGPSNIPQRKVSIQVQKNQIQTEQIEDQYKIIKSEFAKDYMFHNAILRYQKLDIIMEIKLKYISSQYQDNLQRYLIDIYHNFYLQFKQTILDEQINQKLDFYLNFINQLIVRLGDNLVEIGEKSYEAFRLYIFNEYMKKEKSPINQKNYILNIFANKIDLFDYKHQNGIIELFNENIKYIISRNSLKRHEFLHFLKAIIYNSTQLEVGDKKQREDLIISIIKKYLFYNIISVDNSYIILEELMAILSIFVDSSTSNNDESQANKEQKIEGRSKSNSAYSIDTTFSNQSNIHFKKQKNQSPDNKRIPKLEQNEEIYEVKYLKYYLLGLLNLITEFKNNETDQNKYFNSKYVIKNLANIIFIVEYLLNTVFDQFMSDNKIVELIFQIVSKFIDVGNNQKIIYTIDPPLRTLLLLNLNSSSQADGFKKILNNIKGYEQINGGIMRCIINLQNTVSQEGIENNQYIIKLLSLIEKYFCCQNINTLINQCNDQTLSSSILKEKHFINIENNSIRTSNQINPSIFKVGQAAELPKAGNSTSLMNDHHSTYIFYNLLKILLKQKTIILQNTQQSISQSFLHPIILKKTSNIDEITQSEKTQLDQCQTTTYVVKIISSVLINMQKLKFIENIGQISYFQSRIYNQNQKQVKDLYSFQNKILLTDFLFYQYLNTNKYQLNENMSKDEVEKQIDSHLNQLQINFQAQYFSSEREQPQSQNYNDSSTEQTRSERSESTQSSQSLSKGLDNPNLQNIFSQLISFAVQYQRDKTTQDQKTTDSFFKLFQIIRRIINADVGQIETSIFSSIYFSIISSIDLVSSLASLMNFKIIANEKQKFDQQVQELKQSLIPPQVYTVHPLIDLSKEFSYMNSQIQNYNKIFSKKWNKFKKILESQKGVFYKDLDGNIAVQTISKQIDPFGRRQLTQSKPQKKSKYKNYHQFQDEYFEHQKQLEEKSDDFEIQDDDASEQSQSRIKEANQFQNNSETSYNSNLDLIQNDDIDTIKHEREKQIEDIFCKVQIPKVVFEQDGEYITLSTSYFGKLTILESTDDDESEIIFESFETYKRSDKEIIQRDQRDDFYSQSSQQDKESEKIHIETYKHYFLGSLEPVSQDRKKKVLQLKNISSIYVQYFNAIKNSVEIYMKNNKTYFFVLYEEKTRKLFLEQLRKVQKKNKRNYIFQIVKGNIKKKMISENTKRWLKDEMSNFDYLMSLNSLSSRSLNDINQYYVFPWVINSYDIDMIDLNNESIYRDLSQPIGKLNQERFEEFKIKYNFLKEPKFGLYGSHFSTSVYIIYYLLRLEPFSTLGIELQSGKFDHPDRLFFSIPQTWKSCLENCSDLKELIPEFYFLPDFLINRSDIHYGYRQKLHNTVNFKLFQNGQNQIINLEEKNQNEEQNDLKVNNVKLPTWAYNSPHLFIQVQRAALESKYVSENINYWIDLIWGVRQKEEYFNHFNSKTYKEELYLIIIFYQISKKVRKIYSNLQEEEIGKLQSLLTQIQCFGTFPNKIFYEKHPKKTVGENYDIISNFEKKKQQNEASQQSSKVQKNAAEQDEANQKKKYKINLEIEEKENTFVFFKVINTSIYFVKRDQQQKYSNQLVVSKSEIYEENENRQKQKSREVRIEHKINEKQFGKQSYQNIFAFFDKDLFFAINYKSNLVELYYKFDKASSKSFSNHPLTILRCMNNINSGVLVAVANSKIFLADFDVRLLKNSKEQLQKLHIRDSSIFKNIQILYGHFSPIILIEVCALLDIIVSIDQEHILLIHNSDGKCIRKHKIDDCYLKEMSKISISPDGYICILCKTQLNEQYYSTLCLLDINCLKQYLHVADNQNEEFVDMSFINYKSMVVVKKNNIEIWDMFMYHFVSSEKSKILRSKNKKVIGATQAIYKNIGLYYDRSMNFISWNCFQINLNYLYSPQL